MPAQIVPYIRGLIQGHKVTATFLQRQFGFSHDQLTRTLQKRFPWQQLLVLVVQRLFGVLTKGCLIIDDTVIAKPYAKQLQGAAFAYSSSLKTIVYGYHVVLLCWSNDCWDNKNNRGVTIPLAWRFYRKDGPSKVKLAIQLLKEARTRWGIKPRCVFFDTWYAADKILRQLQEYQWPFVCQVKKNRVVSAAPIKEDLTEDGDSLVGAVTDQVIGLIVRNDGKFFLTNDLSLSPKEVISLYGHRWPIEEVFRFLKDQLHLERCQARTRTAQETHLASCVLAYLLIQKERQNTLNQDSQQTMYAIKEQWLLDRRLGNSRINHYVKVLTA